jgi:hypothetical protein
LVSKEATLVVATFRIFLQLFFNATIGTHIESIRTVLTTGVAILYGIASSAKYRSTIATKISECWRSVKNRMRWIFVYETPEEVEMDPMPRVVSVNEDRSLLDYLY